MTKADIGIIGGTGLYAVDGIEIIEELQLDTQWGRPSDKISIGEVKQDGKTLRLAFLPRHAKGHSIVPSEIPQKANLAALKQLGVKSIIAFSAVGSLKEEIVPTHFIVPNQIIDRTRHREDTFFGDGIVAHVAFGDPFCSCLSEKAATSIKQSQINLHQDETLICMEGPAFSTRAESKLYKSWGAGIINMSVLPEAKLARELEICYSMVCMSTDYDSWREEDEVVQTSDIMKVVAQNSKGAAKVLINLLPELFTELDRECSCRNALEFSIITAPEKQNVEAREKLASVLPKYFG